MNKSIPKTELIDLATSEAALLAETGSQTAVVVQRKATHLNIMDVALKGLDTELAEMNTRRDNCRRQFEAVDTAFAMHIEDIMGARELYLAALGVEEK